MFVALIWSGLMTYSDVPCTDIMGFNDIFSCLMHSYDWEKWNFFDTCTYVKGLMIISVLRWSDMMRKSDFSLFFELILWGKLTLFFCVLIWWEIMTRSVASYTNGIWTKDKFGCCFTDIIGLRHICFFLVLLWWGNMTFCWSLQWKSGTNCNFCCS